MHALRTVLPAVLAVLLGTAAACAPVAATTPAPQAKQAAAARQTSARVATARADPAALRVQFVGASVTEGWFASSPSHAYPALVVHGLTIGRRRVVKRVVALPGATAESAGTWGLDSPSDLTVVQLATNDYVRSTPVDVFAASYAAVLRRLRAASPHGDIVCLGGWDDPAAVNHLDLTAREYDDIARSACAAEDGRYIDLSAIYLDGRNHGPDGRPTFRGPGDLFHPNDRGHQELASAVLASL